MKRVVLGLAIAAVVGGPILASAGEAAAQPYRGGPSGGYRGPSAGNYRGSPPRYAPPPRYTGPSYNGYYSGNRWYYGSPPYYAGRDYRPAYVPWRRGQVLPPAYRGSYVYDYNRYGLRSPPPGYRWYYSNGDYVLAAIATGVILDLFLGSR